MVKPHIGSFIAIQPATSKHSPDSYELGASLVERDTEIEEHLRGDPALLTDEPEQ